MQITISNQSGDHANQYPACNIENIVQLSGLGLSKREMSRISGVSQGTSKSPTPCLWEQQGLYGHILKTVTPKANLKFLCTVGRNIFLATFRIWMELIRCTGRRLFVYTDQRRLVAPRYGLGHPCRCPKLTPHHHCCPESALTLWSSYPRIPSASWMQQFINLSTIHRKNRTRPLQLQKLTMVSSANSTWDQW